MKRLLTALGLMVLTAACQPQPSTSDGPTPSPSSAATLEASPSPTMVHAQGVLVAIRATHHSDHDSVEFEFGGAQPPDERHQYETEIRFDPSDQVVTLQGNAFLRVVFHGAALDNLTYENDPAKQEKYQGPTRIAPQLQVVKELAVAGNFESVLSFGIGLDHQARVTVDRLNGPPRVTINLWFS